MRYPWVSLPVLMFYIFDKKTQSHSCGHHSSCVSDELISQRRSNRPVIFRLHWGQRACAGAGRWEHRGPQGRCCAQLRSNLTSATMKRRWYDNHRALWTGKQHWALWWMWNPNQRVCKGMIRKITLDFPASYSQSQLCFIIFAEKIKKLHICNMPVVLIS